MIQANELRIGNYLKNDGVVVKIDARSIFDIWGGNLITRIKKYESLLITVAWLHKFGFEQRDHLWSIDIDRYNKINYNSDQNIFFSGQLGFSIQHDIKYIHQLQNLYFALTGKELTLSVT